VEGVPNSDLCDELGLQPTVFYRWRKEFFENGATAFERRGRTNHRAERNRKLEAAREQRKNRRRWAA
jgi:transposase-like protein